MGTSFDKNTAISFSTLVIGLGALLGALSLCLRSNLGIMPLFVEADCALIFVVLFAGSILVASVLFLLASSGRTSLTRLKESFAKVHPLVAIVCFVLGAASIFFVLVAPLISAVCCGVFLGVAFACFLEIWLTRLSAFSWKEMLVGIAFSLFEASLLWLLSTAMALPLARCIFFAAVILLAGTTLLIKPTTTETSSDSSQASNEISPSPQTQDAKSLLEQSWAAFALLIFNFFTLGLTYFPENAGIDQVGSPHKIAAYIIICAILLIIMRLIAQKPFETQRILGILYHVSLPIAAAIMLVTPFLDNMLPAAARDLMGTVSYLGIAWGNVFGLVIFAFLVKQSLASSQKFSGILLLGCTLGFCAGIIIFSFLGRSAQVVSLCVLAIYLTSLVISELLSNARWNAPAPADGTVPAAHQSGSQESTQPSESDSSVPSTSTTAIADISDAVAKHYGLSGREAEVLQYLARGRSAKYIAEQLYISPETVRTHSRRIYTKTGVHTREELLSLIEHYEQ